MVPQSSVSIIQVVLALLPAFVAALFGASSAAIGALSGARRVALRDSLDGKDKAALNRYLADGRAIETRWLVLRVFGIAASAVLVSRAWPGESGWSALLATLTALAVYAVPEEILAAWVLKAPERFAPMLLRHLFVFEVIVWPLALPMVLLGRAVKRSVASSTSIPPDPHVTETEVELVVAEGEQAGALDHDQSEMIRNVLEFGDLTAADVMVPRTHVSCFEVSASIEEVARIASERGHSRYPVYRERIDNVVGLLHTKDLFGKVAHSESLTSLELEPILRRPVALVPTSRKAKLVLSDMRAGRHHMAIVIDEHGGMAGIVTLEDLIEEIVGDIRDEHDIDEPPIVELADGHLLVDATIPIVDLERYLGTEIPEDGDYHSLGGFIVDRLGRVPRVGVKLVALGHEFVIRDADARRVAKVEIAPKTRPSQPSDPRVTAA